MHGPVCDNCSTPLPVGSKYCNECGTPVPGKGAPAEPSPGHPTDLRQALQMATAGEYEIHHELGRGGMGSVFLAREIGLDRLVAVKVLPPTLMFDEGLIERFKREARMIAKLHHPNIIPVYRVHHSHNLAFYTMHFVPGRSLNELVGPNRVPSLQEVENIMLEAAAGLGYAHKRGVIHRDVKPANILVDGDGHVHLTDFGIAKALVGNTQLTETGAFIGTPQYMAPEQCEGRMVDGRADQYSLAAVGYHLLVGHPPFQSDSMKELLYHHLFTPPRPLSALRPDTPLALRDAIHKSLSKDPVERFDSMEDFRMAIEGKGPPVYVSWLDQPEKVAAAADSGRYRRATDPPTTKRLPEVPWASSGVQFEDLPTVQGSVYRRALGGLAVTILTIAAVAVLAMSKGAGLVGTYKDGNAAGDTPAELALGAAQFDAGERMGTNGDHGAPANAIAMGQLVIQGELPEGARLLIDEQEKVVSNDGATTIELEPGSHTVSVAASGYQLMERDVTVEAGVPLNLAVALVPVAAAKPESRASRADDRRPEVPAEVTEYLQGLMKEGKAFHDMGRYVDAVEWFWKVDEAVSGALGQYRNDAALQALAAEAREAIKKAREACKLEKTPHCP
ncbi:MAG: protein kinase [Gemmatimonadota bacterium]|nr:MAG: protein kinase [Gemmatimonadota bacterium]